MDVRTNSIKEVLNEEDANEEDANEDDDILASNGFICAHGLFIFTAKSFQKPKKIKENWRISKLQKPLFIKYRNLRI